MAKADSKLDNVPPVSRNRRTGQDVCSHTTADGTAKSMYSLVGQFVEDVNITVHVFINNAVVDCTGPMAIPAPRAGHYGGCTMAKETLYNDKSIAKCPFNEKTFTHMGDANCSKDLIAVDLDCKRSYLYT